jgi:methionyl-tRNA formyltransferase
VARLAFLGTPEPAAFCLAELARAGHEVVVVVTEPDRRRGRGSVLAPTPVKRVATELALPIAERVEAVLSSGAEVGVVVAFGRLIRPEVLERLVMVNAHFSLLPRWRGAAPVERAILAGDTVTGVSLMRLDRGLDTGPVYEQVVMEIRPHESAAELTDRLSAASGSLLVGRLAHGLGGLGEPVPQAGEATYAAKISPAEREIGWGAGSEQIERQVRIGRAWTTFRNRRLIIWEALAAGCPAADGRGPGALDGGRVATGDGWLELRVVQPEGRPRLDAKDWWRGARIEPGESLGAGSD